MSEQRTHLPTTSNGASAPSKQVRSIGTKGLTGSPTPDEPEALALPVPPASSLADTPAEKLIQVGELAAASGKTVRAIHLYEELGLLRPDGRSKGRFRLYDPQAVTRVRWIGKLHDLGMSLAQIQEVVAEWERAPSAGRAMSKVRSIYASKLEETRANIARLVELERELTQSIDYLDACETCESTVFGAPLPVVLDRPGVRRLPQIAAAPQTEPSAEVASCSKCEVREREHEPELVAGIHYPKSSSQR